MNHEAPPRLKYTPGAPPELAEVLDALGQAGSDRARVARVEQKLGTLLDAPSGSQPAWLEHVLLKSTTGKLLASVLLAAVGTGWVLRSESTQTASPAPSVQVQAPPPYEPPTPTEAPAEDGPAPSVAHEGTIEPALSPNGEERAPGPAAPARTQARPNRSASPATQRTAQQGRGGARTHTPAAATGPLATAPQDAQAEPALTPVEDMPAPPPAAPPPAPAKALPREAELLLSARKQLRTDPRSTLALVEQHAALFPHGMLAPEREVLAIEALRKLGRDGEATERLTRFRADYPDSPHLRGLR